LEKTQEHEQLNKCCVKNMS